MNLATKHRICGLVLVLAFLFCLFGLRRKTTTESSLSDLPRETTNAAPSRSSVGNARVSRDAQAGMQIKQRPGLPPEHRGETRRALGDAIRSLRRLSEIAEKVPAEKRTIKTQLVGLGHKIFIDDWNLAALRDPGLDRDGGPKALLEAMEPMVVDVSSTVDRWLDASRTDVGSVPPSAENPADLLRAHYEIRIASEQVPGFKEITSVLGRHAELETLYRSDAVKDAWTFAALLGEMQDWERAEEKARQADNSRAAQKPLGQTDEQHAAYRDVLAKHSAMVLSELKQQDAFLASAYGELFEWRFRELHQIQDAQLMLSEIALHPLTGFSPVDLGIPGR
jgi:hypothetical protein